MTIDTNLFWELIEESKIVESSRLHALKQEFENAVATQSKIVATGETAAKWLIKKKVITQYQAKILVAGHSGPMQFGQYIVTEKLANGPLANGFSGRHRPTNYPVILEFVRGDTAKALTSWKKIETLVNQTFHIATPSLVPVFEAVATPNHRFVVSGLSGGKSLAEVVPRKGRLPWKDTCAIAAHVANGLVQLHDKGIAHRSVSPRTIWCLKAGRARLRMRLVPDIEFETPKDEKSESRFDYLAPEATPNPDTADPAADMYSLGCVLYRLISGRTVFPEPDLKKKTLQHRAEQPGDLSKFEIPTELESLISRLLAKAPVERPGARKASEELCSIIGNPNLLDDFQIENEKATYAFRKRLAANRPEQVGLAIDLGKPQVDSVGTLTTVEEVMAEQRPKKTAEELAASIAAKRKNSKWKMPVAIGASLLALSSIIGAFAYNASQIAIDVKPEASKPDASSMEEIASSDEPVESVTPEQKAEDVEDVIEKPNNLRLVQQILTDDDGAALWETPTLGPPLNFSLHPPAPRIAISVRPAQLFADPEGQLILKGLGPKINARIAKWLTATDLRWDEIDELLITLHNGNQNAYEPYFSVRLVEPVESEALLVRLGSPVEVQVGEMSMFVKESRGILFSSSESGIHRFAFGSKEFVQQAAEANGINVLSGTFKNLIARSDADRHFNFVFLRPALFNELGQDFMSGQMSTFNRQLDLFLQDEIRGAIVSFHLDDGNYFEIVVDQTADLESKDLKTSLEKRLRVFRDDTAQFLASIPANSYWDKVRVRYDNMLADVYRNLRWKVEYNQVVGNCWLPPMAAHNLIAGSELVTAFSYGTTAPQNAAKKTAPANLLALLESRRDLNVTTNPDLNVLLNGIRNEIVDEYGQLPFNFEIKLVGNDLQKEGITQNQRPGDFQMQDKSLGEILTEIMVRCNPDKNISGPNDPNCKLVWAVGPNPNSPDQIAILITTREGVQNRKLELPDVFKID